MANTRAIKINNMNSTETKSTAQITGTKLTIATIISIALATTIWIATRYGGPVPSHSQAVTAIANCQTITQSGSYTITDSFSYNVSSQPNPGVCINIAASDVTLNGNGKTITAVGTTGNGQFAVDIFDYYGTNGWHNITVENLNSNAAVRAFGPTINQVTFDHLNVAGTTVIGSDDVAITNNTIGSGGVAVNRNDNDEENWIPYRPVIRNNIVTGDAPYMFEVTGTSQNTTVCPNLSAIVEDNTITNDFTGSQVDSYTMRIRCATHSTVTNNTVRVYGLSLGLYLRDESDDGTYTNNKFITTGKKAIHIGSGNDNKTWPARNVFRNNVFSTSGTYAAYLLGMGGGNQFIDNVFYSHSDLGTPNGDTILGIIGSDFGDTFNHNTFYADGTGAAMFSIADGGQAGPPRVTFTNNVFSYHSAQAVWQYDNFPRSRYIGDHNLFNNRSGGSVSFGNYGANITAWSAGSPTSDTNSITGDPLFTNAAAGDFSLPANSIGHNAASDGTDMGARTAAVIPVCTESWSCGSWGACTNGRQTRACTDVNNCGTTVSKPIEQQSCDAACTETWTCGSWSTCTSNSQTRACNDASNCGTTANKPATQQSCTSSCIESWTCGAWSTCTNSTQTRTCTDANNCGTIVNKPSEQQACTVVVPSSPTTLKISSPRAGARVRNTVLIVARAKDKSGIARVEFRVDGTLISTDTGAPYRAKWNSRSVWNGTHHITVTSYNKQQVATTKEEDVTVANGIRFTFPKPGTLGRASGAIPLTVTNINGGDGVFTVVYKLSKITTIGQTTTAPYGLSWDTRTVKNSYYRLRARVTDSTGRTAEHTAVVKVAN